MHQKKGVDLLIRAFGILQSASDDPPILSRACDSWSMFRSELTHRAKDTTAGMLSSIVDLLDRHAPG